MSQDAVATPARAGERRSPAAALARAEWFGPLLAIVVLSALLAVNTDTFATRDNITTLLLQTTVVAILACGQTFVILTAGIDLSVGAVAALAGTVTGVLAVDGTLPPGLAIAAGLLVGVGVGAVNGALVAWVGIPAFIVTLGGLQIWRGVALETTGGLNKTGLPDPLPWLGQAEIWFVPVPIVVAALVFAIAAWVLGRTKLGLYVYATGGNEEATRLAGGPVRWTKLAVYAISGLTAAIGGIVLIGRLDSSGGNFANGYELDAIAAVVIGGTSLFGGEGRVVGTLLGAILIGVVRNGLDLLAVTQFMQMIAIGVVIVGAVAIDVLRRRSEAR